MAYKINKGHYGKTDLTGVKFWVAGYLGDTWKDGETEWAASEDRAEAKLAGGANAHIILNTWEGIGGETGILENIAYFGAPRNNGFKMMPNEIETWKLGDKAFEFKGTTGFMITIDMRSQDVTM